MTIERYNYNDEPSGRSETLIQALEKIERLEKQLNIAVEALDLYKNLRGDGTLKNYESVAIKALNKIKELDKWAYLKH